MSKIKKQRYEERLRKDFERIGNVARWGSDKLRQLESFFGSYGGPEDLGDKGVECALNHIQSDGIDSVVKIVSLLERSITDYQTRRREYFREHYSDSQEAERAGWKTVGDDFPMKREFLKEVKGDNE